MTECGVIGKGRKKYKAAFLFPIWVFSGARLGCLSSYSFFFHFDFSLVLHGLRWNVHKGRRGKGRQGTDGTKGIRTQGFFSSSSVVLIIAMILKDWHKSSNKACFGLGGDLFIVVMDVYVCVVLCCMRFSPPRRVRKVLGAGCKLRNRVLNIPFASLGFFYTNYSSLLRFMTHFWR
ncbi:hypothetical protein F5Y04DRAFT_2489 [Hypomontagnella monticulosa]|nr:hypothetical protein F5Y04DRAFT_2489 [Hypomontagnella monticulosa]